MSLRDWFNRNRRQYNDWHGNLKPWQQKWVNRSIGLLAGGGVGWIGFVISWFCFPPLVIPSFILALGGTVLGLGGLAISCAFHSDYRAIPGTLPVSDQPTILPLPGSGVGGYQPFSGLQADPKQADPEQGDDKYGAFSEDSDDASLISSLSD